MRFNKFQIVIGLVGVLAGVGAIPSAHAAKDYSVWIGTESKDLPTLLVQFESLCERRYQHSIEKIKSPYEVALNWNKAHCQCVSRFLKDKNDVIYVQVINADLRGRLAKLPPLPRELSMYLEGFDSRRESCEIDPSYTTEDRQDMPNPSKKSKFKTEKGTPPKGIPFRPQKSENPNGVE